MSNLRDNLIENFKKLTIGIIKLIGILLMIIGFLNVIVGPIMVYKFTESVLWTILTVIISLFIAVLDYTITDFYFEGQYKENEKKNEEEFIPKPRKRKKKKSASKTVRVEKKIEPKTEEEENRLEHIV